jgi:hypothetical protein
MAASSPATIFPLAGGLVARLDGEAGMAGERRLARDDVSMNSDVTPELAAALVARAATRVGALWAAHRGLS